MTRSERLAQVRALKSTGLTHGQVAARLGISESTVKNLLYDPDGSKQKARRERYRGTCQSCGARTDGSNGYKGTPDYCNRCSPSTPEHRAKITRWPEERIVTAIREWHSLHGKLPTERDWRGQDGWPWFTTVVRRFGTWGAAAEAAGFTRRPIGRPRKRVAA